jgi:hypothetical protein
MYKTVFKGTVRKTNNWDDTEKDQNFWAKMPQRILTLTKSIKHLIHVHQLARIGPEQAHDTQKADSAGWDVVCSNS